MSRFTDEELQERTTALAIRFAAGEFTETVYRASLFALGWRGDQLDTIANHTIREIQNARRKGIQ